MRSSRKERTGALVVIAAAVSLLNPAYADDLFKDAGWANLASDRVASDIGDGLTVVIYQNAEARNSTQQSSDKHSSYGAGIRTDIGGEFIDLSLGGAYGGRGEVKRSESFITQISARIEMILPNGDFEIVGEQVMFVNGEETIIKIRGVIRPQDITSENQILSTKITNAQISYDGEGFVSRSSRPGLLHSLFSVLGLVG